MKKIPTIFLRNPHRMQEVTDKPNPDCQWVFTGGGWATRKYDGTCCKVDGGKLFKRREVKPGKAPPADFVEEDHDPYTGKLVGWVPVSDTGNDDRWHREAYGTMCYGDGTYELCGPKVQKNPEGLYGHRLVKHASATVYDDCPRTFGELKAWLACKDIEGIVFKNFDGRMAKIKKRDFGLRR